MKLEVAKKGLVMLEIIAKKMLKGKKAKEDTHKTI